MQTLSKKGVRLWRWQRITAIMLIVGISLHFAVTHFLGDQLGFTVVNERLQHIFWIIFDALLLLTALVHGFGGLWSVYLDYNAKGTIKKFLGWTVAFLVIAFTIYGSLALAFLILR
ncbi:MAG: succinate dehydrogenase, hydrophobic membrane anchor protein [Acidobacteria bacterium]|nr:succinate dehydrogenase, hydrophobic membrane anchor protein [Acidobacteriota bacterium]